jgi:replication-associated recombination protein RarA
LHKSLRGSVSDAALARAHAGGRRDPIYILRRLTRAVVEDIGLPTRKPSSRRSGLGRLRAAQLARASWRIAGA